MLADRTSIDEAQALVRRCAEPRSAGESVKGAIRRAAQLLDMPYSRTKDIWYADPRVRIAPDERDHLRRTAGRVELNQAIAAVEVLQNKLTSLRSQHAQEVLPNLATAIQLLRSTMHPDDVSRMEAVDDAGRSRHTRLACT